MGIGGSANFQRNLDFIEGSMPSVNEFTNLTDYGLNVETATRLGIMVPVTLDNATKRDMVEYLNGLSLGEQEKLWKIRLEGANINGALSSYQFTENVRHVSATNSGGGNTSAYAGAFIGTGITEYSNLVKNSAAKIERLDSIFRSRLDSIPELIREAKTNPRIARLLKEYPANSLYQLQTNASADPVSRGCFRQFFKPFLEDINDASFSLKKGSLHILTDKMTRIQKLLNANDTKPIAAAMDRGVILADLEDVKALARYAKIGKFATRGLIGVNIITAYSNLFTVSDKDFGKTFAGDTGALVGGSIAASAGSIIAEQTLGWILGDTLLCCGPIGWGVLLVGVAAGVAAGYLGGEGGEWSGDKIWEYLIPNKDTIGNWLTEIGKMEIQRAKNGYY